MVNETAVNGVNYKDILSDGALCYDIEEKTLTAKERINYVLKVRAPETDVILNGGIGARSSLTIGQQGDSSAVGAHDVTVTSDRYDAIQGEADINCTGKVNIRSDKSMAADGKSREEIKAGIDELIPKVRASFVERQLIPIPRRTSVHSVLVSASSGFLLFIR